MPSTNLKAKVVDSQFLGKVYFKEHEYILTIEDKIFLDEIIRKLEQMTYIDVVELIGDIRARKVKKYLITKNIDPNRIIVKSRVARDKSHHVAIIAKSYERIEEKQAGPISRILPIVRP